MTTEATEVITAPSDVVESSATLPEGTVAVSTTPEDSSTVVGTSEEKVSEESINEILDADTPDELVESLINTGFTKEAISQFEADLASTGDLSEESYNLLKEKGLDDLARVYLKSLRELTDTVSKQAIDSYVEDVARYNARVQESNERIIAELGGLSTVEELVKFKNSLSLAEIEEFDRKADQLGDVALAAYKELQSKYAERYGSVGAAKSTPTDGAQHKQLDVFNNKDEYFQAIMSKEFQRNFKYATEVRAKLERSIQAGTIKD